MIAFVLACVLGLISVVMLPVMVYQSVYWGRKAWLKAEIDFFDAEVKDDHQRKDVSHVERKGTSGTQTGFGKEVC